MEKILSVVLLQMPPYNKPNSEFPFYSKMWFIKFSSLRAFQKHSYEIFIEMKNVHTLWPSSSISRMHPTDLLTHMPMTGTRRFIAALLIMVKGWKSSKCLLFGDWLNKLCYVHPVQYNAMLKMNLLYTLPMLNNIQNTLKSCKMQKYAKQCIWYATGEIYKSVFAGTCINYIWKIFKNG